MQALIYSMASNYNSRYKPAEALWMNGQGHLIRAHETFEDLLKIKFHYQLQRWRKI
jgi:diaminopimelate decarboxylase